MVNRRPIACNKASVKFFSLIELACSATNINVLSIIVFKNKRNFYIVSAIGLAIESKGNGEGNGAMSQRAISGYKPQRLWQNILLETRETEKVEIFEIGDKV